MRSYSSCATFALATPLSIRVHGRAATSASQPVAMKLEVGQNVRVSQPITMYHYPGKKNAPVEVEGFEGVIIKDDSIYDGVEISATNPYVVQFPDHPKFKAHFTEAELEVM